MAKLLTSTLVGAAIQDGKIKSLEVPVTDYIPELKGSAYEGVTVRQMLMMSSGVKWNEDYADLNSDVAQAGLRISEPGVDPMVSYLRKLPRAYAPGAKFNYNTGETDLVGMLVANAVGKPLAIYASEKIWKPYGMEQDAVWMIDLADRERGGCCISMTLRDYGARRPVHPGRRQGGRKGSRARRLGARPGSRSTTTPRRPAAKAISGGSPRPISTARSASSASRSPPSERSAWSSFRTPLGRRRWARTSRPRGRRSSKACARRRSSTSSGPRLGSSVETFGNSSAL